MKGRCARLGTPPLELSGAPADHGDVAIVGWKYRSILFDAKVITGKATYAHEERQYRQLEELRDHQALRGIGFLLLADQDLGVAYLVERVDELLARRPIVLRETPKLGAKRVTIEQMTHNYPFVRRPPDFTPSALGPRWDWLTLLNQIYRDG